MQYYYGIRNDVRSCLETSAIMSAIVNHISRCSAVSILFIACIYNYIQLNFPPTRCM